MTRSRIGQRLSIPLVFCNNSRNARPVSVLAVAVSDGASITPVALDWEQVDSQSEHGCTVDSPQLTIGGTRTLTILTTLSSRYKGREERYAFASPVTITVEEPDSMQVSQTINLQGAQLGTGGLIHSPFTQRTDARREEIATREREALPFARAERYELINGIRGYKDSAQRVQRHVAFNFPGFPMTDRPPDGAQIGRRGVLAVGRAGRDHDPVQNPNPSDLVLAIHGPRSGAVDEKATLLLSRNHFEITREPGWRLPI